MFSRRSSCPGYRRIEQNDIRLLIADALDPDNPIAQNVNLHGDGVKGAAFLVDGVGKVFGRVVTNGAKPITEPARFWGDRGLRD
jgi:4-hydroxyphenylpyruvate dioxygenase-like putative hemolysin